MVDKERYNVVFMGLGGENSNHPGIITWTSFTDKSKFDAWRADPNNLNRDVVVAAGVTQQEAIGYDEKTPDIAYLIAATAESTLPDGSIDMNLLRLNLEKVFYPRQTPTDPDNIIDVTAKNPLLP